MRKHPRAVLALASLLVVSLPSLAAAQEVDDRPGVAVLPFDVTEFPPVDLSGSGMNFGLQQMFVSELRANSALRVIDRRAISAVMQEMQLHGSGNVDASTASEIGRIVGARYMIGGSYWNDNGQLRLDMRVIDGETTEIVETARNTGPRARLFDLIGEVSEELVRGLDLPALEGAAREERRAFNPPEEALELFSYAIALDEGSNPEKAVETLEQLREQWPRWGDPLDVLNEIKGRGD